MTSQSLKLSLIDGLIHLNDEKLISEVQSIRKKDFVRSLEEGCIEWYHTINPDDTISFKPGYDVTTQKMRPNA